MRYIIALDQGTTSSRTIVYDERLKIIASAQKEFKQIYPCAGMVEHDPYDILNSQLATMSEAIAKAEIRPSQIAAIGITNQRETTIVWDKTTGKPIYNAIVWQCRRTAGICEELKEQGADLAIQKKTGLILDAYFSGTKIKWILDNVAGARERARNGQLCFGTVDSWLIWNLTGGAVHATDMTNASRTMLFNINTLKWDKELLELMDIPEGMLPEVKNSCDDFGRLKQSILGAEIPIMGVAGDQHASLFGQGCYDDGDVKNTYGTGCFMLMKTGKNPVFSKNRMLTTIAWSLGKGTPVQYALEGSVFMGGATIQWLRDEMKLIATAAESEFLAMQVPDTNGVYLVPAFSGLAAPWWDMYARGTIVGITRGTNRAHIVRAALEAIAYQSYDLLRAMETDTGISVKNMRVDGGASTNDLLMQYQAELLGVPVIRPRSIETTACGAAALAGLSAGLFTTTSDIQRINRTDKIFRPGMDAVEVQERIRDWHKAVQRALQWAEK